MLGGIVYDLDGTLVDSSGNITAAVNRARQAYGLTAITVESCLPYIGNGAQALIQRAVFGQVEAGMSAPPDVLDANQHEFGDVYRRFYEGYVAHPADGHTLFPGVRAALERFAGMGIPQAVLTNKPHGVTLLVLDALDLSRYFVNVLGAHAPLPDGSRLPPKPVPLGMELILASMDVSAEHAVMVGDGRPDVRVAHACGMRSVAIGEGFAEAAALKALNPTWFVDSFQDAADVLASLIGPHT